MYAVIFRATFRHLDDEYHFAAEKMRDLAFSKYGCIDFVSVREGDHELTVSYWDNEEQIKKWKSDPEHSQAQKLGMSKWYKEYQVQVTQIEREYKENS